MGKNKETTWLPTGRMLAAWEKGRANPETLDGQPLEMVVQDHSTLDRWWIVDGCHDVDWARGRYAYDLYTPVRKRDDPHWNDAQGRFPSWYGQIRKGNGLLLARADAIREQNEDEAWQMLGVNAEWMDYSSISRSQMISWTDPIESVAVRDDGRIAVVEFLSCLVGRDRYGATIVHSDLAEATDDVIDEKIRRARELDASYFEYDCGDNERTTVNPDYNEWSHGGRRWLKRWLHSLPLWAEVQIAACLCYQDLSGYSTQGETVLGSPRHFYGMRKTAWMWLGELLHRLESLQTRRKLAEMTRRYGPVWLQFALSSMNSMTTGLEKTPIDGGGLTGVRAATRALDSLCSSPAFEVGPGWLREPTAWPAHAGAADAAGPAWTAPADERRVLEAARMAGAYQAPAAVWPLFYVLLEMADAQPGVFDALGEEATTCLLLPQPIDVWGPMLDDLARINEKTRPGALSMMTLSAAYRHRYPSDSIQSLQVVGDELAGALTAGETAIDHGRRLSAQAADAAMAMGTLGKTAGEQVERGYQCYRSAAHALPSDLLTSHLSTIAHWF